jgi:hypothetical protein
MSLNSQTSVGAIRSVTLDLQSGDVLVPVVPDVCAEVNRCSRTVKRWIADREFDFPRVARIKGRTYVSRRELEAWKGSRFLASLDGKAR